MTAGERDLRCHQSCDASGCPTILLAEELHGKRRGEQGSRPIEGLSGWRAPDELDGGGRGEHGWLSWPSEGLMSS